MSTTKTATIHVATIARRDERNIYIPGWRYGEQGQVVETLIRLPKKEIHVLPLGMSEANGPFAITVPVYMLLDRAIAPTTREPKRYEWRVQDNQPKPRERVIDPRTQYRAHRHIDAVLGDLAAAREAYQETVAAGWGIVSQAAAHAAASKQFGPRIKALEAELAAIEAAGEDNDGLWAEAAEQFDGEPEIASHETGVPLNHPQFWAEVTRVMLERRKGNVRDHRTPECNHGPQSWCGLCDPEDNSRGPTKRRPYGTWKLSR